MSSFKTLDIPSQINWFKEELYSQKKKPSNLYKPSYLQYFHIIYRSCMLTPRPHTQMLYDAYFFGNEVGLQPA